jgi:parvulin-like peptidyl-prolyl isomerase
MKRNFIIFLLAVFSGTMAFAQADLQTVALVTLTKSEPITVRQLKTEIEKLVWQSIFASAGRIPTTSELNSQVQKVSMDDKRQVLDAMINERLFLQAAERDKITVTDNEVNQRITQLKAEMAQEAGRQVTDEEFAIAIKNRFGMDLPALRDSIKRQGIIQKYLQAKKQALFSSVKEPTNEEIVNFYNLSKANFVRPDTVRVSMIQVPYGSDTASKNRAKEAADRLVREIGSDPSKFDEAVIKGRVPNSGYEAGDAGYLPLNAEAQQYLGANFMNTAFSLKQGEVSRLIEGIPGYQIIKITETLPMKVLGLDDAILGSQPPVTVRQYIAAGLLQQKQNEILVRASNELTAELRAGNPFRIMENNLNW